MKIPSIKRFAAVICLAMLATLSIHTAHKNQHVLAQPEPDLPGSYSTAINTLYTNGR